MTYDTVKLVILPALSALLQAFVMLAKREREPR